MQIVIAIVVEVCQIPNKSRAYMVNMPTTHNHNTGPPTGNWSCVFCKGISVPSAGIMSRNNSSSRDILLQKANKVINNGKFAL